MRLSGHARNLPADAAYFGASVALFFAVWWIAAGYFDPVLLPSPIVTGETAWRMVADGELALSMGVSYLRICAGWLAGGLVGAILGLLMGRLPVMNRLLDPLVEFARFIPPISFLTLFIIWLGVGELSKVLLIAYATVFVVSVNVAVGAASIREGYVRAARSLGASPMQIFFRVFVPRTVPYMMTGMRLAMGNAFMTIVAAEILASKVGVGHMIWNAQAYMQTAQVFVGFAALCVMGFTTDRLIQYVDNRFFHKYQ
jgi:NitT/TauT family transport system permease protein